MTGIKGTGQRFTEAAASTVQSIYTAIENRDLDQLQELVAPNAFVLTPESHGVLSTSATMATQLGERLDASPNLPLHLASADLRVGTTAEGFDAWVSDQLFVTIGSAPSMQLRITAALSRNDSGWLVTAGHCSLPLPNDEARALMEAGRLAPGVALPESSNGKAQPLVKLLDRCLSNPELFSESCSTGPDTVAFGSASEEVFYGPEVKKAWEEFIGYGPRMERRGGASAAVSESGDLGWVATHIDISFDITSHTGSS